MVKRVSSLPSSWPAIIACCLLLSLFLVSAFGSAQSNELVQLTDDNFEQEVLKREGSMLVEFYSPSCGHCVSFGPELVKIARELRPFLPTGQVDVTKNRNLLQKYNIHGVPTLFLFPHNKEKPIRFEGKRDQRTVVQFVLANVNHSLVVLTAPSSSVPRFIGDENAGTLPRLIYFASPDDPENDHAPVPIATLAKTYRWQDSLLFGFVRGNDLTPGLKTRYSIDALPALYLFSSVNLKESEITPTWSARAITIVDDRLFIYRYTGSLKSETELNDFCNEASARSTLYYETHQGFAITRTTFNILFLVTVLGVGVAVFWYRRTNRDVSLLPTTLMRKGE